MTPRRSNPPADHLQLIWMYECGATLAGLARHFHRDQQRLRDTLTAYGVHIRNAQHDTRWTQNRHRELNSAPPSYTEWLTNPLINTTTTPTRLQQERTRRHTQTRTDNDTDRPDADDGTENRQRPRQRPRSTNDRQLPRSQSYTPLHQLIPRSTAASSAP